MKNFLILSLGILLLFSCGSKQEPKSIFIVRHAEKMLDSQDPILSIAGTVRSKKLAQILENQGIEHIYSTNTIRTKATAQPLAEQKQLQIKTYDVHEHDELVDNLRDVTGNILVVGHSNTVNQLVNYFIGKEDPYKELDDNDYDFIFIVDLKADGTSIVKRKTFKEF